MIRTANVATGPDDLFRVLESSRRRFVLRQVSAVDGEIPVELLGHRLASWEAGATPVTAADERVARIALEHVHLPRLAAAGLVTYDAGGGAVERAEWAGSLGDALEDASDVLSRLRSVAAADRDDG